MSRVKSTVILIIFLSIVVDLNVVFAASCVSLPNNKILCNNERGVFQLLTVTNDNKIKVLDSVVSEIWTDGPNILRRWDSKNLKVYDVEGKKSDY